MPFTREERNDLEHFYWSLYEAYPFLLDHPNTFDQLPAAQYDVIERAEAAEVELKHLKQELRSVIRYEREELQRMLRLEARRDREIERAESIRWRLITDLTEWLAMEEELQHAFEQELNQALAESIERRRRIERRYLNEVAPLAVKAGQVMIDLSQEVERAQQRVAVMKELCARLLLGEEVEVVDA